MLEKYLSRILTSKFEHVVEDFDEEAVNVSAWKGEVSLHNLILKRTAFDTFNDNVPVDIVYGKIGKLELLIPWSSLGSKSSSIVLTDVDLLIAPREADQEKRPNRKKSKLSKEERVQALLNPRILQHSIAASHKKNRLARFLSWVSSSLFSNLSITVRNIHIRYEDPGSSLGFVWNNNVSPSSFAVGLTLSQFSVQTTNIADQDNNDKLAKNYKVTRKLAAAYQLAVYWDHECPLIAVVVRQENDSNAAREHAAAAFLIMEGDHSEARNVQQYRHKHSYVLQPISPSLQFNLVTSTTNGDTSVPPSTVIMSLPPCHLIISRTLLENVAYLRKSFAYWKQSKITEELNETLTHLNRIRPTVSPRADRRAWWRYAIEATILLGRPNGQRRRRRGWSAFAHALLERHQYVSLYRRLKNEDSPENVHAALHRMEEELDDEEIAFFRLAAYEAMIELPLPDPKNDTPKSTDAEDLAQEIATGNLSVRVRRSMMNDAIRILKEGRNVASKDESISEESSTGEEESSLQWKTSLFCPEMSLQVNGRNSSNSVRPIARLSFACVQRQFLRRDGSWELDATVAGVKLIDMGVKGTRYPTLIGSKPSLDLVEKEDDFVIVSGQRFRRCMQVQVERTFTRLEEGIGSTTHSVVRLQPLEVVYSANPVERITNVFLSIRTPELAGDYERVASVISQWQQRQRQRFLQALAHKRKRITVDLDIAAPVIMIPENQGSGAMLVIDLGRVQLRNVEHDASFDDVWSLELSDMQLQSSHFSSGKDLRRTFAKQQIIEPFSLEFKISTSIALPQKKNGASRTTSVVIDASLPRLVFNLKASSVRLASRLKEQGKKTKQRSERPPKIIRQSSPIRTGLGVRYSKRDDDGPIQRPRTSRVFKFLFSAPIIAVKLENDVDGRGCGETPDGSTPLLNLAFRGIGGAYVQNIANDGSTTSEFDAKMKALEAVDLYQQAGSDFALLLSSVPLSSMPDVALRTLADQPEHLVHPHIKTNLVSVRYETKTMPHIEKLELRVDRTSSLSIKFHELFVEWNPETIAAIHKAMKAPVEERKDSPEKSTESTNDRLSKCSSGDEFFDAFEDDVESFCSASEMNDKSSHLISEIASSRSSLLSEDDLLYSPTRQLSTLSPVWVANSPNLRWPTSPLQPVLPHQLSPMRYLVVNTEDKADATVDVTVDAVVHAPFELSFELSTLRVAFNKETRHRRLVIAEMDNTSVRYSTRKEGGSRTVAKIGNLVFTDPSFSDNSTLYSQILGLKTDGLTMSKAEPSLFELEFISNSKERHFESIIPTRLFMESKDGKEKEQENREGVTINTATGEIQGCNNFVNISFSPMRFVYLQQLWFEIIDYFFEGIVGYEVWGNMRPKQEASNGIGVYCPLDQDEIGARRKPGLPGSDAKGISFTRFKISLASPDVLLPVEYRSPHFLRLTCQSLEVSNYYSSRVHQVAAQDFESRDRVQWYNNCSMHFQHLRLQSWCGKDLSTANAGASRTSDARIQMTWPTGPTKQMVVPKWRVRCDLDEIDLSLRSQDYALFQHIGLHNIGESSRHLDEWTRFQEMPVDELEEYKAQIMVHYGYDKKDAAPSTYDVEIAAPSLGFNLLGRSNDKEVIAQARCLNLSWKIQRSADLVSRQRLVSNVMLVRPLYDGDKKHSLPLLLPTRRGTARDGRPDVVYTSTTKPITRDNVKTLEVIDAGINLMYPAWMEALAFFSNLGEPSKMTRDEIQNSLQVGDRWYSISSKSEKSGSVDDACNECDVGRANDNNVSSAPNSQFRLLLESPRIVIDSESDGSSVILHMDHLDYLQVNDNLSSSVRRTFFVHDLELYTVSSSSTNRDAYSVENSLISPWSFLGRFQRCSESGKSSCESHTMEIAAEVLKARAAYSDMIVALHVARRLLVDFRSGRSPTKETNPANKAGQQTEETTNDNAANTGGCSKQALITSIHFDGVEILVVDDSMRHFANAQELISVSLGKCMLLREEVSNASSMKVESGIELLGQGSCPASLFVVRVSSFDLFDHLQKAGSRFSLAATSRASNADPPRLANTSARLLEWHAYATLEDASWGFKPSPNLLRLLGSRYSDSSTLGTQHGTWSLEYESLLLEGVLRKHKVDIQSFTMQWNPSTVIALQRFLGRLLKEVHLKSSAADVLLTEFAPSDRSSDASDPHASQESHVVPTEVLFSMGSLSVCLNKEHQNRRLLKATVTGIRVTMRVDASANSTFVGGAEDVQAWDEDTYPTSEILDENRVILRVKRKAANESDEPEFAFFHFQYTTYSNSGTTSFGDAPSWIVEKQKEGSSGQGIDDYLSISIASLQLSYFRGRTEELIDFLSNGLPGKGMGLTSKAAKGFIKKRIQTRSFLELTIAAPELRIPQHEESGNGLLLHLGDVQLRTWFELEEEQDSLSNKNWCRALSVSVLGLGWNAYFNQQLQISDDLPVDLHFDLRKPKSTTKAMVLQGRLSFVVMRLRYSDYRLLHAVLANNVGKKVDVSQWDNIEKAYWMEAEEERDSSEAQRNDSWSTEQRVAYSSSARFVRYGPKGRLPSKGSSVSGTEAPGQHNGGKVIDFGFKMDGISLTLHRDDDIDAETASDNPFNSEFNYDVVLLILEVVEVSLSLTSDGDKSLNVTLSRIGLYDKGDTGRLAREHYFVNLATLESKEGTVPSPNSGLRNPSAFSVIVEGYAPAEADAAMSGPSNQDQPDPQLVLTVDTCPASAVGSIGSPFANEFQTEQVTVARMVINYLSVNAMIRPLREIISFLSCAWSPNNEPVVSVTKTGANKPPGAETSSNNSNKSKSSSGFQLKLVAHYPRIFFVADESDAHSRALVLRGLAVVNASIFTESSTSADSISAEVKRVFSLDANLQSMESFINPDVSVALGVKSDGIAASSASDLSALGVALIQPVTAGIEFQQVSKERFPTIRSTTVSMESVSTMLSFEDLGLINQVIKRWFPEGRSRSRRVRPGLTLDPTEQKAIQFEVVFRTSQLGMVLKNSGGGVVVDRIETASGETSEIRKGDRLLMIDGVDVPGSSLHNVVQVLAQSPRPMKLIFLREATAGTKDAKHVQRTEVLSPRLTDEGRTYAVSLVDAKSPIWYKLHFKMGVPNGIVVQRSHGGDIPVIREMDASSLSIALVGIEGTPDVESGLPPPYRVPRTGTAIVAVSGIKSVDLGFDETSRVLEEFTKPSCVTEFDELQDAAVYSISFVELTSDDWGSIDSFDACIAGVTLTFIDDFQGRDMPLLRGKLDSIELHCDRGIGLQTDTIDTATASVFGTVANAIDNPESGHLVEEGTVAIRDLAYERILKLSGSYQSAMDYYHPRIAVWEPLLEPSQLALNLVWKPGICSGSQKRPGQLAFEISDNLNSVQRQTQPGRRMATNAVSLNITDAAAEVLARTFRQLNNWRDNMSKPQSIEDHPQPLTMLSNENDVFPHDGQGVVTESITGREEYDVHRVHRNVKRAAAREAAQAALVFAQKRGAHTQLKGESAKPFLFRNKTGIDLQFSVQQRTWREQSEDSSARTVIAADSEARFQLEIVSLDKDTSPTEGSSARPSGKKVRSYDGYFPPLAVWILRSQEVLIEPLVDLQVSKVGTFVRELKILRRHKDASNDSGEAVFLPLIWQVELEDNRRILTLSSAVQISSVALGLSLDVGFTRKHSKPDESTVEILGTIRPGESFCVPLWMSLHFEHRDVYVRPSSTTSKLRSSFGWGDASVLKYEFQQQQRPSWVWSNTFKDTCSIMCVTPPSPRCMGEAIWLSCLTTPVTVDSVKGGLLKEVSEKGYDGSRQVLGIVNIVVDSSTTLRNMLPIPLCWELADLALNVADGSSARAEAGGKSDLDSGACVEVFTCDVTRSDMFLRVRPVSKMEWTDWARISIPKEKIRSNDDKGKFSEWYCERDNSPLLTPVPESQKETYGPRTLKLTVQTVDDFGCPVQFGIRVTPKLNQPSRGRPRCYGLELVVFAELWFSNLTNLPIDFGCPWSQLCSHNTFDEIIDDLSTFESASKAAAESALLEIASVLEFGDKGKGLQADQRKTDISNLHSMPLQASDQVFQEVFEFIEIESSTVKRRWWASEQYDSQRQDIAKFQEIGSYWKWIDDSWILDCSGRVRLADGAWESCRSLTAGRESYFSGRRTLDPGHIFRRRRWFRRLCCGGESFGLRSGISCFHHPVGDSFVAADSHKNKQDEGRLGQDSTHRFSLRSRDGEWSSMAHVPQSGPAEGVIRVLSSRWPTVTKTSSGRTRKPEQAGETTLMPELYELCYSVSDLPGEWGEFSRIVTITPRFLLRNDSSTLTFEVKQAGVSDQEGIRISPGDVVPFYWKDFRLPELVSIRPLGSSTKSYRWSGGFDICTLGTVPLRIRSMDVGEEGDVFSVKALVEIRPSSSGVNISLKEEDVEGLGAMFRVENHSPFPIWIAQDGVLANPSLVFDPTTIKQNEARRHHNQVNNLSDRPPEIDGDVVLPRNKKVFALDVPFRQGKYASRKAATLRELLRVRIGLAPLSTRDGIETTKLISFTSVGDGVRLNPTKLRSLSSLAYLIGGVRVLGVVVTDGPTRVLRFALMEKDLSGGETIGSAIAEHTGYRSSPQPGYAGGSSQAISRGEELLRQVATKAAMESVELKQSGKVPKESEVRREASFNQQELELDSEDLENDIVFSFRGHFGGFLFSLVDSAPSEIAAVSVRGLDAAAKWNMKRTGDATALISIAWLQIDNHVPNAPYPVAVCPDQPDRGDAPGKVKTPLLMLTLKFAPRHQSGVLCLRHVTIAPSNLAIAIDLAFIVRLQGLIMGIRDHFTRDETRTSSLAGVETIPFPDIATDLDKSGSLGSESLKLYFEGLLILPSNVNLSVAPARGLTPSQALLEGSEAAAIHAAVRKGDIRLAGGGMVGVSVGRTNRTAMAVVRGVFKSILVDALLRLDGASLNLAGVSLSNHMSSGQQLKTYLVAHYLASLRENMPALLGSLAAFGNPLGLIRGIGDGVSDFVSEPVKGLKRSVEELDPAYVVDGVARGTESLARHTVGGIADSASMLTETFSKNMAVLTLDRRYAQRRDTARSNQNEDLNFVEGVESGVAQLVRGVVEGFTGVVQAPIRGAEKNGFEGFAKGFGKGLLGLLVKPMIGLSDAATDVMVGVRGSVDAGRQSGRGVHRIPQLRPRRTMYGRDRTLRIFSLADAAASTLMYRTNLAGENYLSHLDMGDRVLLVSEKKFVLLGPEGQELLLVKFKDVKSIDLRPLEQNEDGAREWGVFITLSAKGNRSDATHVEVLTCGDSQAMAAALLEQLQSGLALVASSS